MRRRGRERERHDYYLESYKLRSSNGPPRQFLKRSLYCVGDVLHMKYKGELNMTDMEERKRGGRGGTYDNIVNTNSSNRLVNRT